MQAANSTASREAPAAPATDIATKIALAMRAMGVSGFPRNYEIYYEVFTGTNQALNAELGALGNRPRQEDLDRLSLKYFVQSQNQLFVDNIREQIANKVEEVMILCEKERIQLERYGHILHQTSSGLTKRNVVTQDVLQRVTGIISEATASKIEQGKQTASSMADKSAELESVKSKLEEYKKLADTDALTQIWNRRAFDRAIADIYGDPKKTMFSALVIADIDEFKLMNDRYGHPVGDRIIQHVAGIIRATASADMFVARTGGEEFAVLIEGLSEERVFEFAEKLRHAVGSFSARHQNAAIRSGPVTVSVGICMAAQAAGADDLYAKADRALYMSKAEGRNKTTRFSSLPETPLVKDWLLYRRD